MKRTSLSILIVLVVIAMGAPAAFATFPGTNGRIIWLKNGHVASVKPDGSGFRRLTTGTSDYMETPTCSPDGRWVTFAGQTATLNYDIWLVREDGAHQHRVTNDATEDYGPSFSPDGRWILFSRDRGGSFEAIFEMKTDGTHRHVLFDDAGDQQLPRLNPAGTKIVFESTAGGGPTQLWIMRADGTNAHAITSGSNEHYTPSWSPNGKRILYIENNFVTPKIVTILPDGSGRRVLPSTVASIDTAVLSPDGTRLAITDGGPQYLYNQKLGKTAVKIGARAGYTALDWCPA